MILKLFKLPDGNQSIIVHGLVRFRLLAIEQTEPFAMGRIEVLEDCCPRAGAGCAGGFGSPAGESGHRAFPQYSGRSGTGAQQHHHPIGAGGFSGGQSADRKRRHQRKTADAG